MALTALHHHAFRAMDCDLGFWLAGGDAAAAQAAFAQAEATVHAAEAALSRFRPDSELMALNRQAGRAVAVSPLLWAVINEALAAARRTGGLFDPAVLHALEAAGYDRTFAELDGAHGDPRPAASGTCGGWREIVLDAAQRTVTLPPNVGFDLGGIAKGWLAEAVAGQLGVLGPCLVDLGGDIAAHGAPAGQPGWPVSIVDPWHPDSDLVVLALRGRAIATSGTDHRQWDGPDGGRRHHIIDPRTGAPAVTDALTVSVVAADAVSAEVLAKVALLQGAEAGAAYVEQAGAEALVITERGALVTTAGFTALEWAQATQAVLI